ncbi:MAG: hypothetical protein ACFE9L_18885 [Candidatus Hodarchaeota archaeon]
MIEKIWNIWDRLVAYLERKLSKRQFASLQIASFVLMVELLLADVMYLTEMASVNNISLEGFDAFFLPFYLISKILQQDFTWPTLGPQELLVKMIEIHLYLFIFIVIIITAIFVLLLFMSSNSVEKKIDESSIKEELDN